MTRCVRCVCVCLRVCVSASSCVCVSLMTHTLHTHTHTHRYDLERFISEQEMLQRRVPELEEQLLRVKPETDALTTLLATKDSTIAGDIYIYIYTYIHIYIYTHIYIYIYRD